MAVFEVVEQQGLKLIKATIRNEQIRAEAGALHYMQGAIEIETQMPSAGGFLKSLVTHETVFKPTYKGTGTVFFGPPIFGEYMILPLNGDAWVLDRGAYVCSDIGVTVSAFRNKAITGLLGEGIFQTKVEGNGQVVIKAPGPLHAVDLVNDRLSVDGNFAVARQAHLNYELRKATKSIMGSLASGEGLISVIEGSGRVYIAPVPNLYHSLLENFVASIPMPKGS
jgi:uncharacterized protein (AIM24 family)